MADIIYPDVTGSRGIGYWLRPKNLMASRQKIFRVDYSNEWRYEFGDPNPLDRSVPLTQLLPPGRNSKEGFRIIILGDTGEGDRSQYGLVPLISNLNADFIIINGDIAYPAGRMGTSNDADDFLNGFFRPYSNLNCPIWATIGNHEYYSPNNGRDFYDIFCTRKFDSVWSENGLRHSVLQPGMFWELDDSNNDSKLVIIGLDSGKSANLDGKNDWWQVWKRKIYPDFKQHQWLEERLIRAQNNGSKAIILFHIPALAKEKHLEKNLSTIHKIIAKYSCVKLVLCGHDHNHQQYSPADFHRYLELEESAVLGSNCNINYMVNGGGGAFLQSTDYKDGSYNSIRYPTQIEWRNYAGWGRRIVSDWGKNKSWISRAAGIFSSEAQADADAAKYLSLILVDFNPQWEDGEQIHVTPVFLDDINQLYEEDEIVNVMDKSLKIKQSKIDACLQNEKSSRENLELKF